MQQALNLPPQFAIALDPDFIRAAAAHAAGLKLPRRTCRPLETVPSRHLQIEVSDFDAAIDAAFENDTDEAQGA